MKILVEIGHPAHVHHFKNMIWKLERDGHKIKIAADDKEVALNLLDAYGFCYEKLGKYYKSVAGKLYGLIVKDIRLLKIAREYRPDMFISRFSPHSAHISMLLHKPHISFDDTEGEKFGAMLAIPFTDAICTPTSYKRDFGKKHVRFNGYTELAYLHPNYFTPDPSVLEYLRLSKDDKFVIVRFVSWAASLDKQFGLDMETKKELIKELEKHAQVFITSEEAVTKVFEKYRIAIPPEKMHDLLYYATMYIGEGATMASEAAVLGTPAIYTNTWRGYLEEEEEKYGLVYNFSDPKTAKKQAIIKAVELLENKNLKKEWQKKRERLLNDKIDVTKFMTDFIENYPESVEEYK